MADKKAKHVGMVELTTDVKQVAMPGLHQDMATGDWGEEEWRVAIDVTATAFYVFIRKRVYMIPLFHEGGPIRQLVQHIFELDDQRQGEVNSGGNSEDKS